jgi:hypothetical protein
MARLATVSLRDHVSHELLVDVVRLMCREPLGFVQGPEIPPEDADVEPFLDWDATRGHGAGFFCGDAHECRSRRIDLRGPTDLDPGPLPMEEAPEDVPARLLLFRVASDATGGGRRP